jgi:hypothetical protein
MPQEMQTSESKGTGEPAMASFVRYLNPTASEERKRTLLHSRVLRIFQANDGTTQLFPFAF